MSSYTTHSESLNDFPALPENAAAASSAPDPKTGAPDSRAAETSAAMVYAVGEYVVGDADDTLLNGHPDIRY
ncbi:hypothetical protein E5K00_21235 [Hymenobacter aquaticus]|uniref:Uncharacterized protein n=1 Tax=Hymenobacter aquaticus TaxID=1867101 RepID=A0A4Z0PS13_9BACT|nr:hypothetical protein [Hymenobacter aquaticus]TGE20520.1 hypothetical protein E5K00_21235 [Hymenobacter aquaticus]